MPVNFKRGKGSCRSKYDMSNIIIGHPPQKKKKKKMKKKKGKKEGSKKEGKKKNPFTLAFVMRLLLFSIIIFCT